MTVADDKNTNQGLSSDEAKDIHVRIQAGARDVKERRAVTGSAESRRRMLIIRERRTENPPGNKPD